MCNLNVCDLQEVDWLLNGLKLEIKSHARIFKPQTQHDAYALARL